MAPGDSHALELCIQTSTLPPAPIFGPYHTARPKNSAMGTAAS